MDNTNVASFDEIRAMYPDVHHPLGMSVADTDDASPSPADFLRHDSFSTISTLTDLTNVSSMSSIDLGPPTVPVVDTIVVAAGPTAHSNANNGTIVLAAQPIAPQAFVSPDCSAPTASTVPRRRSVRFAINVDYCSAASPTAAHGPVSPTASNATESSDNSDVSMTAVAPTSPRSPSTSKNGGVKTRFQPKRKAATTTATTTATTSTVASSSSDTAATTSKIANGRITKTKGKGKATIKAETAKRQIKVEQQQEFPKQIKTLACDASIAKLQTKNQRLRQDKWQLENEVTKLKAVILTNNEQVQHAHQMEADLDHAQRYVAALKKQVRALGGYVLGDNANNNSNHHEDGHDDNNDDEDGEDDDDDGDYPMYIPAYFPRAAAHPHQYTALAIQQRRAMALKN